MFFLLIIISGAVASSALALRAGLGIVHLYHSALNEEKTALNLQGDLDVVKKSL